MTPVVQQQRFFVQRPKITPSVERLVAQRSNLMQLLSVVCESSFVKTISWFASIATTPMICESMLCRKYDYASSSAA